MAQWLRAQLIEEQPMNDTICVGSGASFSCEESGAADLFQWEHSTNNVIWNAIPASDPAYSGESTTTLQISSSAAPGLNMHWYRIIVTDSDPDPEDIDTSNSVQLIVNSVAIPNPTFINPLPCGTATGSFTITGLMNGIEYEVHYTFDNMIQPPVLKTAINNQVSITNLLSGSYSSIFVIHQGNSCSSNSVGPVTLVDPTPNAPTAVKMDPTTCVPPNGSITFNGLNSNWAYVLNYKRDGTPQMPQMISTNVSGSYTLLGLSGGMYSEIKFSYNNNECEAIYTGNIMLSTATTPAPTISGDVSVCVGETIQYMASAADDYIWTVSNHGSIVGPNDAQNVMIKWNTAGTMATVNVAITATNGCTNSSPSTVAVFTNPSVNISVVDNSGQQGDNSLCSGDMIQLTANASGGPMPYSYVWTPGNSGVNPLPISSGGTYSVKVTDNNLCSANSPSVTISETPTPPLPGVVTPVIYCVDDTPLVLMANGMNLEWNGVSMNPPPVMTNVHGSTPYTVTQTVNFCESDAATINVVVHPNPVLTVSVIESSGNLNNDSKVCDGETFIIKATGNSQTYKWHDLSDNDSLAVIAQYNDDMPFPFSVIGSITTADAKTCHTTDSGNITIYDNPKSAFAMDPDPTEMQIAINTNIFFTDVSLQGESNSIIKDWQWIFGDGASPPDTLYHNGGKETKVKYSLSGLKDVSLSLVDNNGCLDDWNVNFAILGINAPQVTGFVKKPANCLGDTVELEITVNNTDPNNFKLLSNINIPNQNGYSLVNTTQVQFNENAKLVVIVKIVFTEIGNFSIIVEGFQMEKSGGNPQTFSGFSSPIAVSAGKEIPNIVSINSLTSEVCRGDTIVIIVNLTTNELTEIVYNVNNAPQNITESVTNGSLLIQAPSNELNQFQLNVKSLNLTGGCENISPDNSFISVGIKENPVIALDESKIVCIGSSDSISVSGAQSYEWFLEENLVNNTEILYLNVPTGSPESVDTYLVTGHANDCESTDSIVVNYVSPPNSKLDGDETVCKGQVIKYRSQSPEDSVSWTLTGGGVFKSPSNVDTVLVAWSANGTIKLKEQVGECKDSTSLDVIVDEFSSSPPYNEVVYLKGGGILLYSNQGRIPNLCYQWYINGNAIPGDTFQGIVIGLDTTHIREYSVEVYYCDDTQRECKQFIGYRSSVVEEESAEFGCIVYPNPNDGAFNLDIEAPIESDFEITAFDFSGREIFNTQLHLDSGIQTIPLTMYNVSGGMYLLRAQDKFTGQFVVAKVLIVK